MPPLTNKSPVKFELQTFITILVFVFGLGTARASLNSKQVQIISKLDELSSEQKDMIATRDAEHKVIDDTLARLTPTVHTMAKMMHLEQ